MDDVKAGQPTAEDVADLKAMLEAQSAEIADLKSRLAGPVTSRRGLLKSAGMLAGGVAAAGALGGVGGVGGSLARPQILGAVEGHNVRYGQGDEFYLILHGQKQGWIKGNVIQKGQEGWIACSYYQLKGTSPRDPATGQATGKRQYQPLVIRKGIDQASPKLTAAFITNEILTSAVFKFYQPSALSSGGTGELYQFYTVELENATIISQNQYSPDANVTSGGTTGGDIQEEISFVFEKIFWTYTLGGVTAQDDFASGV